MEGEVTVPTAAKRCRCCMTPGIAFKDLSLEYEWMGEKEVYADMLLESFDVTLERNTKAGWTICDACISRLRDSSNFKKQVLYSERCLLQGLFPSDEKTLSIVYKPKEPAEMKLESQSEGDDAEEFETHYLDEDLDLDEDVKEIKQEPIASTSEMSNDEDTPLSSLRPMKVKSKVAAKVKSKTIGKKAIKITVPPEKLTVKKLIQRQKLTTKPQLKPKPNVKILESSSSHKLIKLSTKPVSVIKKENVKEARMSARGFKTDKYTTALLVENSNITPFKWAFNTGYRCFYCNKRFLTPELLLEHTKDAHDRKKFSKFQAFIRDTHLNFDVSDMKCALCQQTVSHMEELRQHLIISHQIEIGGSTCKMIPFELLSEKFVCSVCAAISSTFLELYRHTQSHFSSYVCNICGEFFLTQVLLNGHLKKHSGDTTCLVCSKVFSDIRSLKSHVSSVHTRDRIRCQACNERFANFDAKLKHLISVHKSVKPLSCPACDKVFLRKIRLDRHYSAVHLNLRQSACELCGLTFHNSSDVARHKRKVHFKDVCPY